MNQLEIFKNAESAQKFLEENQADLIGCMELMIGTLHYLNRTIDKHDITHDEMRKIGMQIGFLEGFFKGVIDRQSSTSSTN